MELGEKNRQKLVPACLVVRGGRCISGEKGHGLEPRSRAKALRVLAWYVAN